MSPPLTKLYLGLGSSILLLSLVLSLDTEANKRIEKDGVSRKRAEVELASMYNNPATKCLGRSVSYKKELNLTESANCKYTWWKRFFIVLSETFPSMPVFLACSHESLPHRPFATPTF